MIVFFLWFVVFLLGMQLLLLFGLISWKVIVLKIDKKVATEVNYLIPLFKDYIEAGQTDEKVKELEQIKGSVRAIEQALDQLAETYVSSENKLAISELAEFYLADPYKQILIKGNWAERINALYFIEDFRIYSLREDVFERFQRLQKQDEEYRQCLRTAAVLEEAAIIDVLVKETSLSVSFHKELLYRMNDEMLNRIAVVIRTDESVPQNLLFAFITFNGEQKNEKFFPFIEQLIFDERKEVRIKAMKSLCSYGKVNQPSNLASFFKSVFWEERMYAAKLTGACRLNEFKESLAALFSDSVWWVRFAAADNVYELESGAVMLKEIGATSKDAYARDIANHMLIRKGGKAS